jgi:hypothetical protein
LEPDFGTGRQWRPLDQALAVLRQAGAWRQELIQLLRLLGERADRRLHPLPWALPVPLSVHGRYSRAEIEAAFGVLTTESPWIHREGVLWHQASATDLLFITLRKSEALLSPSTRYRDLALGPALFHWESQSTTTAASPTGQRYIHHAIRGSRVLLFVREQRKQDGRPGAPPNPSCAWALRVTKATRVSGSCSSTSGDSLAAGAGDPGGVVTRLLLGIKVALAV